VGSSPYSSTRLLPPRSARGRWLAALAQAVTTRAATCRASCSGWWLLANSLLYQRLWRTRYFSSPSPSPSPSPLARAIGSVRDADRPMARDEPQQLDMAPFGRQLRELIALARSHDARVLLATMPTSSSLRKPSDVSVEQANDILRRLAAEGAEGVALTDLDRQLGHHLQPHFTDVVHLDEEGRRRKAEHIGQATKPRADRAKPRSTTPRACSPWTPTAGPPRPRGSTIDGGSRCEYLGSTHPLAGGDILVSFSQGSA
jgi:hypothetical protein